MKIQLDTDNLTIKLEENVLLSDLVKTLNKILPNGEWKKFTLETHTVIEHWSSPIVIEKYVQPYRPYTPWQPWYYSNSTMQANVKTDAFYKADSNSAEMKSNSASLSLKSGVYNIEA